MSSDDCDIESVSEEYPMSVLTTSSFLPPANNEGSA